MVKIGNMQQPEIKNFKCLKNNSGDWLDITEMYIGTLSIGEIYKGHYVKGYSGKYISIFVGDRKLVLHTDWFEEV